MSLKPQHWAIAISLSAAAHLAMFVSSRSAQSPASERSAGTPAAVWGVSANALMQEAEPVEEPQVQPKPMEEVEKPEQVAELKEPDALPEAISEQATTSVPSAEVEETRPVETIKPIEKEAKPKPKPKKKRASLGGPVGRAAGNSGQTRSSSSGASLSNYYGRVLSHLRRHKRHPGGRVRGTVRMVFVVGSNGSLRSVKVTGRSGSSALDSAALAMVRRASPFPSFPAGVGKSSLTFSVPVKFSP